MNQDFITAILKRAEVGIIRKEINDLARDYNVKSKEVSAHILAAKDRGMYNVPQLSAAAGGIFYQYNASV